MRHWRHGQFRRAPAPDSKLPVLTSRSDFGFIPVEADASDMKGMLQWRADLLPGVCVPDACKSISTTRHDVPTARTDGQRTHVFGMLQRSTGGQNPVAMQQRRQD